MHAHQRSRRGSVVVFLVAWLALAQSAAGQVTPPLTGESFLGASSIGGQANVQTSCNPSGTSRITFTASGPAEGNYPGTFAETGEVTLTPGTSDGSVVVIGMALTLQARFTIDSPAGQVVGLKTIRLAELSAADCGHSEIVGADGLANTFASYDALIRTEAGTCRTQGEAEHQVADREAPGDFVVEFFNTGTPCVEVSKKDCNDGLADTFFAGSMHACKDFVKGKDDNG